MPDGAGDKPNSSDLEGSANTKLSLGSTTSEFSKGIPVDSMFGCAKGENIVTKKIATTKYFTNLVKCLVTNNPLKEYGAQTGIRTRVWSSASFRDSKLHYPGAMAHQRPVLKTDTEQYSL